MKKKLLLSIGFLLCIIHIFPIYRAPEVARYYYWMFSPDLLSMGMGYTGTDNPSGIVINPASNAFNQNIKFELSYGIAPAFWVASNNYRYDVEHLYTDQDPGNKGYNYNTGEFKDSSDVFWPFIINLGIIIPSKYGNFTLYANYMNMSNNAFGYSHNNDLGIGKVGSLYLNFSKDYDDHFAFGFSGNIKFNYNPFSKYKDNKFDVAGGFDFGFTFKPEWFSPFSKKNQKVSWGFQDFVFSIVIKDIAKPFINFQDGWEHDNDLYWFPAPFTPAAGMTFKLYEDGKTYWKWLVDVAAPFCQNLTIALGTEIQIYSLLILRCSYTFDLEGVLEYTNATHLYEYMYNIANVAFGLSFKFNSDFFQKQTKEEAYANRHKRTSFSIDIGGKPYHNGFIMELGCSVMLGTRDATPPEVKWTQKNYYASPNFDGINDNLIIDLSIVDERFIRYWKVDIIDSNNKVVRTIEGKEPRKESMTFKDVLKKYFTPKQGIPVPKQIVWDGKDNNGNVVPDGSYTFRFYAMDDNKNEQTSTPIGSIIIDTDKPLIKHEIKTTIFSPNDDGNKDTLPIEIDIIKNNVEPIIETSNFILLEEKSINKITIKNPELIKNSQIKQKVDDIKSQKQIWYVDILNAADKVVRTYKFEEKGKQKIEWDGKDSQGNKMPDGVYKVKLHSVDLAGNYWEEIITNIILNTEPTPVEATTLSGIFSPNGDGKKDTIGFKFKIPITTGVEKWKFDIIDKDKKVVRTYSGNGLPKLTMEWDGKDNNGNVCKEGDYKGVLTLEYINGNRPNAETPLFTIDLTKPQGNINLTTNIFSPNGDGNKDDITISHQNVSDEDEWNGFIYDSQGKKVKSFIWKGKPPEQFVWDGKDDNNKLLPDGSYYYQIASTDTAGNFYESQKTEIKIFTEDVPVFIIASLDYFSPNNDKIKDTQIFEIKSKETKDNKVSNWELNIFDKEKGFIVFTEKRSGSLPQNFEWDGKNSNNKNICNDGLYYAELTVNYEAGTSSKSKTKDFIIDNLPPQIEIKAVSDIFSPNNDGNMDILEILQKGSKEELWEQSITDKDGRIIFQTFAQGEPDKKFIWDGKDQNNNLQPNGIYKYIIKSTDKAGNSNSAEIKSIELKNIWTSIFITLDDTKFSPNKDGKFDTIKLRPFLNVKDDLEVYKLEIFDKNNRLVKTFEGEKNVPEVIEWDGIGNNNRIANDGEYYARLSVIYRFGNRPQIDSTGFILDNTPPKIDITISPEYFSPDDDGIDDELTINISSYDLSGIKEWNLAILNPDKADSFHEFNGIGKPTERIIWNGKDKNGELVESAEDYPLLIKAIDNVGNELIREFNPIMVDILVIKLPDDRYKIKISNIQFEANSAKMTDSPKNTKVINLLTKALRKYSQYKFTIEGHANPFLFTGRYLADEAKKLSNERANTIANILARNGISKNRMTIVGKGGDVPIYIPPQDIDIRKLKNEEQEKMKKNVEKNRRVEFYLEKN